MRRRLIALAAALIAIVGNSMAKEQNQTYLDYINQYSKIAVADMKEYGIPASITLAQGLLESGAGKSELAKASNNHFGIKCHDWKGDRVYFDDDQKGECFRKYDDPKDSFRDHALFLKDRPRYSSLFELKTTDYKGWAKGLKQCGYATDPNYASRLIKLIEDYDLNKYDKDVKVKDKDHYDPATDGGLTDGKPNDKNVISPSKKASEKDYHLKSTMGDVTVAYNHTVIKQGRKQVVIAQENDTYESIAKEFGLKKWEIRWYNKAKKGDAPQAGNQVVIKKF